MLIIGIVFGERDRRMHKIVLNFGLLVLCISIIYYSQKGDPLEDVILTSMIIFLLVTIVLSLGALFLIKTINKIARERALSEDESDDDLDSGVVMDDFGSDDGDSIVDTGEELDLGGIDLDQPEEDK